MPETTQVKTAKSIQAEHVAMAMSTAAGPADNRPRFKTVTLANQARLRLKRQYIDGTIVPARREQILHGVCELIDATRFLEVRVTYTDMDPEVFWIPWAQVAQVEPL